jgi:hypothetical protein
MGPFIVPKRIRVCGQEWLGLQLDRADSVYRIVQTYSNPFGKRVIRLDFVIAVEDEQLLRFRPLGLRGGKQDLLG